MIATTPFRCIVREYSDRPSWLDGRRSVIGASDTAGIFGVGYHDQSPATIWDSKLNPQADDRKDDRRLTIGKLMEPALRAIFADETGLPCEPAGEFTIYAHPDLAWLGATLDGLTVHDEYGPCPVELKNVSNFNAREWEDDPPLKFAVQVQHQLAVTGASHGFLLGLIGGNEPVVKVIERNERFIDAMLGRLTEFWGYVERKELPPVDASLATAGILSRLWPQDSGATIFLPAEAAEWDRELCEAKEDLKTAEARKVAAENKIKAAMGEASFAELPGSAGSYSWKTQNRKGFVVEPTSFRVLRRAK